MSLTYEEAKNYLYEQLPMFQRVGTVAFKPDLFNIRLLLGLLDNPQEKFPTIHVAGTNGKGSVSSMLAAVLAAGRYKTGLFTSPHLVDYSERIRINGKPIAESFVIDFVERLQGHLEKMEASFFEVTTALAFAYFAYEEVDIAVIEVGLGGRLDSTNIIQPLISVITNIGLDHEQILGNTLEKIAREKAGIIKPETPVVVGRTQPETESVFRETAQENEAILTFADQKWEIKGHNSSWKGQEFEAQRAGEAVSRMIKLSLAGHFQRENLATALETLHRLNQSGIRIPAGATDNGLANVRHYSGLAGRMMQVGEAPLMLCDTGHNADGVRVVVADLDQFAESDLHIVWGMVADKSPEKVFQLLPKGANYYFVKPDNERCEIAEDLLRTAEKFGLSGRAFPDVMSGYWEAVEATDANQVVFVGGSNFVVGEFLAGIQFKV